MFDVQEIVYFDSIGETEYAICKHREFYKLHRMTHCGDVLEYSCTDKSECYAYFFELRAKQSYCDLVGCNYEW